MVAEAVDLSLWRVAPRLREGCALPLIAGVPGPLFGGVAVRFWFALGLLVGALWCALGIVGLKVAEEVLTLKGRPVPPRWALVRFLLWAGAFALVYAGSRVGGLPAG